MKELIVLIIGTLLISLTCATPLHLLGMDMNGSMPTHTALKKPHIVFLISKDEDNYQAHKTIPRFARKLRREKGYKTSVLLGKGARAAYQFPQMELVAQADVLVVFCRRLALKPAQMEYIVQHLETGKPLMGIRTANHAFSVRDSIEVGYVDWWDFVPEVLGCFNKGYGPVEQGTKVKVSAGSSDNPMLKGLPSSWHSDGNLYKVSMVNDLPYDILLEGSYEGHRGPIAWTCTTDSKSPVFYTSLGHPTDFKDPNFERLLLNAMEFLISQIR